MINCSVTAFPQPDFQWILQSSGELFPESSWVSIYHNKTAYSTLMYTFTTLDFNDTCTAMVVCRAKNVYGTSEQYFTLYLNNCSTTSHDDDKGDNLKFEGTLIPVIAVAVVIFTLAVPILLVLLLLLRCIVLRRKRR